MNLKAFEELLKKEPLVEGSFYAIPVTFKFAGVAIDISSMTIYWTAKKDINKPDDKAIFDILANHLHPNANPTNGITVFEFGSDDLVQGTYDSQFSILNAGDWLYSDKFKLNIGRRVRRTQ